MKKICLHIIVVLLAGFGMVIQAADVLESSWKDVVRGNCDDQGPGWWGSAEAIRIAENVLLYQKEIGGWQKNTDMHLVLTEDQKDNLTTSKSNNSGCTIDNGAVDYELTYLSKVYNAISDAGMKAKIKTGFQMGVHYLIEAQYDNGGWPQFYPLRGGYSDAITYNDDAMVNVLYILKGVYTNDGSYSIAVPDSTADQAEAAYNKGIECILNTQYAQDGKLTVWCQQHDRETLKPTKARSYELASLSGQESARILTFLMDIDNPSRAVQRAIYAGIKWFEDVKITGIRIEGYINDDGLDDIRVVNDPGANPLWARFYTLEDNRPFFCDRDGIKKWALADIGHERRNGYSWYGKAGEEVGYAKSSWLFNWSSTILAAPYHGQVVFTKDTVNVLAFADQFASENFVQFELTLDTNQTFTYTGEEIDTFFTGLSLGDHSMVIKAVYENDYTEADTAIFTVALPVYQLTVNNGTGSGEYTWGKEVTIEAGPAPEGRIFDKWTGDIDYIGNINDPVTTFTIPDTDASIRATYKQDPDATDIDNEPLASEAVLFYPNPVRENLTIDLRGFSEPVVEIFDMQGRKVYVQGKQAGIHTVPVDFLAKGTYLIRVSDNNQRTYTSRLSKF